MLRDELVIAKTVDFLVEHATAVSPAPAASEPATPRRQSDESAAPAARPSGTAGKAERQDGSAEAGAPNGDERRVAAMPR